MIFGVLSLLNATLTLPGIAGIVLTVGIAVDSNVLIYERIREEVRGGPHRDHGDRCRLHPRACDHPRLQHHDLHRRGGAVLHRHRAGARLRRDARHRHHHHRVHRLHADAADRVAGGCAGGARSGLRSHERNNQCAFIQAFRCCASSRTTPSSISCASGASAFRCRRCCRSWRSCCSFIHGLNFGIDFVGGTLMEVQSQDGPADLAKMRATLGGARPRRGPAAAIRRADRRADPRRAAAGRRGGAAGGGREGQAGARRRQSSIAASRWSARASRASCWPTARSA